MAELQAHEAVTLDSAHDKQVEREPAPKKQYLKKNKVLVLSQRLRSIKPLDILATVVAGVETDAAHFKALFTRETLWHCIRSSIVLF